MLSIFTDTLPKSVLAGALVWAGVSYFAVAPEAAARITRADFLPLCEADFKDMARLAGEEQLRSLQMPALDPMQEHALAQVQRLQNNPFMNQMRGMSQGMGDIFGIGEAADAAMAQMNHTRRTAQQAYEQTLARIERETATRLAKAGTVCGCVADMAIAETRIDWAWHVGTFTIVTPPVVQNFDQKMAQVYRAGGCDAARAGA